MLRDASVLTRESARRMDTVRWRSFLLVVASAFLLVVSSSLTSFLLAKSIGGSIRTLVHGTERIAAGDLAYRVNVGGNNEISRFAAAFNDMTAKLETSRLSLEQEIGQREQAEEAIRELNQTLEQRIVGRTIALAASEQRWATTLASIGDAVIATDLSGRITFMNRVAEELTGWTLPEASTKPVADVFHIMNEHTRNRVEDPVAKVLKEGAIVGLANHTILARKDGTEVPIDDSGAPIRDREGKALGVVLVFHDITDRKRMDQERETTVEFLRLVNESTTIRGLIQAAVGFFKRQSGCEAVGVRLREGDDYPYFEVRGFPQEFVLLENQLCARDSTGEIVRDGAGNPVIECMCGNIICGRFDPSKPFFSAGGSFWTNSTTEMLASTTEVDRQSPTRNRCNGEGYESVALLPLQSGEGRIGLLQLNDRRRGQFTPEIIALWERLAGHLATAVAKFRAEESLKQQAQLLQLSYDAIIVWRMGGRIEHWNRGAEELYGFSESEALGRVTHDLLKTIHLMPWPEIQATMRKHGQWEGELRHSTKEGREVIVSARHQIVRGDDGIERVLETNRDITERKRAEEALQHRTLELEHLTETLEERVKERTAELANLSSQLVSAQENERKRVSYDLHDNVWQSLEIIRSQIEHLFSKDEERIGQRFRKNRSNSFFSSGIRLQESVRCRGIYGRISSMTSVSWPPSTGIAGSLKRTIRA